MYNKFQVKPLFIYDREGFYANTAVFSLPTEDLSLLGILNSKLGWFLISHNCTEIQNGYQLIWDYFKNIPIANADANISNQISLLVDQMLAVKKNENEIAAKQCEIIDRKIDKLVYELYGLTDDEIKIVEGK